MRDLKSLMEEAWFFNWVNPFFWAFVIIVLVFYWTVKAPYLWCNKQYKNVKDYFWIRKNGDAQWTRKCWKNLTGRCRLPIRSYSNKKTVKLGKMLLRRRWKLINQATKKSCQIEWQSAPF